jgi:hypothetical protein
MSRAVASRTTGASILLLALSCTACTQPVPPPTEQKPEPQANTELRDAIKQPIDKAKAVEEAVKAAADQQRASIDAAAGG